MNVTINNNTIPMRFLPIGFINNTNNTFNWFYDMNNIIFNKLNIYSNDFNPIITKNKLCKDEIISFDKDDLKTIPCLLGIICNNYRVIRFHTPDLLYEFYFLL